MPDSTTGSAARAGISGAELEAKVLAMAERARQRDHEKPSETAAQHSLDGEAWRIDRELKIALVPDVYRAAEWDKVRSPAIRQWTLAIVARTQRGRMANPALLGHGMLILGPTGTGKSSAAALACRAAIEAERTVRWTYVPDLVDRMSSGAKERLHEIRMQTAVDLLVWDDFGVRDLAEWEIGYLDQIVEGRSRALKPMIVTSNWTSGDIKNDVRLARLVDRWRQRTASQLVVLSGESMRG